jgi:hypothetical protein
VVESPQRPLRIPPRYVSLLATAVAGAPGDRIKDVCDTVVRMQEEVYRRIREVRDPAVLGELVRDLRALENLRQGLCYRVR